MRRNASKLIYPKRERMGASPALRTGAGLSAPIPGAPRAKLYRAYGARYVFTFHKIALYFSMCR
jgi:hypothetical protein